MNSLNAFISFTAPQMRGMLKRCSVCGSLYGALINFWIVALTALVFGLPLVEAQSPNDGHIEGDAYLNSYFHVSYHWPAIVQPMPARQFKNQPSSSRTREFLLFMAKQGNTPFGIVMLAEKPSFHVERSDGLNESQTLLEQIKKWWDTTGTPKVVQEMHSTNSDGLTFYELDYIKSGVYTSAITTQVGEFQLVFRCDAGSASDLTQMEKSVLAMRRIN